MLPIWLILKPIIWNKYTAVAAAVAVAVIAVFFSGMAFQKSCHSGREAKATVKAVEKYVRKSAQVRDRFNRLPHDVDGVLSGRASAHSPSPLSTHE